MTRKNILPFIIIIILTLALNACAPAVNPYAEGDMQVQTENIPDMLETPAEQADETMDEHSNDMEDMDSSSSASNESSGETAMDEGPMEENNPVKDDKAEIPAWLGAELTDVRDGEKFTINDFKGKVVLVETLAIWCSNCRKQQQQVVDLHSALGEREDFVSVGLDIDPNEDAEDLKDYIEKNGFHWIYAVAPSQVGNDLANLYGSQFLNPPSTPMLIVDKQGSVHLLPFGIKSAQDLQEALQPFLAE